MSFDPYEKLADYHANTVANIVQMFRDNEIVVESPIEKIFSVGMEIGFHMAGVYRIRSECNGSRFVYDMLSAKVIREAQKEIGQFRVDFLFTVEGKQGHLFKLVVECDGHDFHERTKEQAAKDRSRDRDLTMLGYTVIRFTGSEIYRKPAECAEQAFMWIWNKSKECA